MLCNFDSNIIFIACIQNINIWVHIIPACFPQIMFPTRNRVKAVHAVWVSCETRRKARKCNIIFLHIQSFLHLSSVTLMLRQGKLPIQLAAASFLRSFSKSRRSSKTIQRWEVRWAVKGESRAVTWNRIVMQALLSQLYEGERIQRVRLERQTRTDRKWVGEWNPFTNAKCESEAVRSDQLSVSS